jgi:hypothetical protein
MKWIEEYRTDAWDRQIEQAGQRQPLGPGTPIRQ